MLGDWNLTDTSVTNSGGGTGTFVCYYCHDRTVYNSGSGSSLARIGHQTVDTVVIDDDGSTYADRGIVCLNCHSGGSVGGIHGNNRTITTLNNGDTQSYRFMYGNELMYDISEANWETTTQPACYTAGNTAWGGSCTKHGSASTGRIGSPNYSRPLE
jgi:hypothetical protein